MTSSATVSVIMPAFNEALTIGAQLAALARQEDVQPTEIIVADNGSTDATLDVVRSYQRELPQLRWLVADAVPGPSHARNEAARVAVGDVLAFCDSDDEVDDRWLASLLEGLQRADFVGGPLDIRRLNSGDTLLWREVHKSSPPRPGELAKVVTSNMAIRSDAFRRLGMFDESFVWGHDHEFSYRAQLSGLSFEFIPGAIVHYRIKTSLKDLLRREYQDSIGAVHVYAKYRRRGLKRRPTSEVLKLIAWLVVHLPDLLRRRTAGRWLRKAAGILGRVHGSIRHRAVCL